MTPEYREELLAKVIQFEDKAKEVWAKRGKTAPPKEAIDLARRYLRDEAS